MKKQIMGLCLLMITGLSHAESRDWNSHFTETRHEFQESEIELNDLPNPNEGDWFNLYINEMHQGTPRILLSSVHIAPDQSVRYILNQRSAKGYDNLSAEGMLCVTGHQFLGSDGAKVKTFGYGDVSNQRWIMPRKNDWAIIGNKMNGTDKVRGVLYQLFCINGLPKTDDELRKRIQLHGGRADNTKDQGGRNSNRD